MERRMIPIQEWLETFRTSAEDLARGALRFDPRESHSADTGERPGAYIALLCEGESVHLGLCLAPTECHALARALLGLGVHESLSERDTIDGVCEVMNIVAGKVKSQMASRGQTLRLGLPMFLRTPIEPDAAMEVASTELLLGSVAARLTVYRRSLGAQAAA